MTDEPGRPKDVERRTMVRTALGCGLSFLVAVALLCLVGWVLLLQLPKYCDWGDRQVHSVKLDH